MINALTNAQQNSLNRAARDFAALYTGGFAGLMNDILSNIASGNIGIQSAALDVDSIALGGGACSPDPDNTTGLTFAWKAGRLSLGSSVITISAGTIALSASQTNYVEVDKTGTVFTNTSAFTANRCPLYTIVTGSATITSTTVSKALLTLLGLASVTGAMLSTPAATKSVLVSSASIAATTSFVRMAPCDGTVSLGKIIDDAAISADDTNYWTFSVVNKGQAGAGSANVLDTGTANTTKATGGAAMAAYTNRTLTLSGTGANLILAKNDALLITATKTGSPTALTNFEMRLDIGFVN